MSLVAKRPSYRLNIYKESALVVSHAATLKQKLLIKLAVSPNHSIRTLGHPVSTNPHDARLAWQGSYQNASVFSYYYDSASEQSSFFFAP